MPLHLLQTLITYPTITPKECGIYDRILEEFTKIAQNQRLETIHIAQEEAGVKNCFFAIKPKDKPINTLTHFCFAGHIDVVPTGDKWSFEPFSGVSENGYIHGRGAQDMKGGVSAFIRALTRVLESPTFIESHFMFSILLTSDEEGDGIYGTRYMLEMLKNKSLLPQMCIVAEPTSQERTGDMLKIGRRGSMNGIIIIEGKQGHVAYPQKCINPIELLGSKLGLLAGIELDNGDAHFAPSKLVITDIRGGMEVVNVTPQNLKIMFNIRFSPLCSEEIARRYIDSVLGDMPYQLSIKVSSMPFITSQNSKLVKMLTQTVRDIAHINPELSTSGGVSDARFFAALGIDVIELGVPNDRIHSIDEKVRESDVIVLCDIFTHFLRSLINSANSQKS